MLRQIQAGQNWNGDEADGLNDQPTGDELQHMNFDVRVFHIEKTTAARSTGASSFQQNAVRHLRGV